MESILSFPSSLSSYNCLRWLFWGFLSKIKGIPLKWTDIGLYKGKTTVKKKGRKFSVRTTSSLHYLSDSTFFYWSSQVPGTDFWFFTHFLIFCTFLAKNTDILAYIADIGQNISIFYQKGAKYQKNVRKIENLFRVVCEDQ